MGCSYIITSVDKGKAVLTNSFLLTGTSEEDKAFQHEQVEIESCAVGAVSTERGEA